MRRLASAALLLAGCATGGPDIVGRPATMTTPIQQIREEQLAACRQELGIGHMRLHVDQDGGWRVSDMQTSQVAAFMACAKSRGAKPYGY
jgi:hypothetical protein